MSDNIQEAVAPVEVVQEAGFDSGVEPVSTEPTETTETTETTAEEKLFAGKFKTPEDLEKGYNELYKNFLTKNNIPESYSREELAKELTIDLEENEIWDNVSKGWKENNFTNDQVKYMLKEAVDFEQRTIESVVAQYGPLPDMEREKESVSEMWGDKHSEKTQVALAWAKENLPQSVYRSVNFDHKALAWAYESAQKNRGPSADTIVNNGAASSAPTKAEIHELIGNEKYYASGATGSEYRAMVQKKIDSFLQSGGNW